MNLKKNQVIILFWILLFGFILMDWGKLFGIPYLFLDPEYQGKVNGKSLFILGLGFGIFNASFQITCYILDSERFRFLSGFKNAIFRFLFNNSILPLFYILIFCWQFWHFQVERGLEEPFEAALEASAFVGGFLWVQFMAIFYFRIIQSKQMIRLTKLLDGKLRNLSFYRLSLWKRMRTFRGSGQRIGHFISPNFSIHEAKNQVIPVRLQMSQEVFSSNHLSAVMLELVTIVLLLVLGIFSSSAIFQIPAGASIFLFFGFILMIIGAISFWLRGWSISIFVGVAFVINILFSLGVLNRTYQAFGINYGKTVEYSNSRIRAMADDKNYTSDSLSTIEILTRWKAKTGLKKPKMLFVCTSGGGIRSATWTMRTLQFVDSILNSRLIENTVLITGASGGLLGAAYFRELFLQSKITPSLDYFERKYIDNMSKDILNPVVFSLITNDIVVRLKKYNDGKYEYNSDRGLVFEQTLNQNLNNALNKSLYHYKNPEREAIIPMMFVSPVIVNDGRKLYISPQPISYMTWEKTDHNCTPAFKLVKGIEMTRFFNKCDAMRLNFSSALRMNATFPYITPNVTMPTQPSIEVMDGGLSDNFGVSDALKFIHTFKDWIENETSGTVLICIRDTPKEKSFKKRSNDSWFSRLVNPVGSVYANWARNQDHNNDMQEEFLTSALKVPMEVVTFQYLSQTDLLLHPEEGKNEERASLSWHLTTFEKQSIESSILNSENAKAIARLKNIVLTPDSADTKWTAF